MTRYLLVGTSVSDNLYLERYSLPVAIVVSLLFDSLKYVDRLRLVGGEYLSTGRGLGTHDCQLNTSQLTTGSSKECAL